MFKLHRIIKILYKNLIREKNICPLSCFRQSATGAAAGDYRGRQWPSPPSTIPAAGSGGMAVGPPISGPWPWLGPCLFSGTAPFAAPYSCCKLWWLLPLVRRDRGPLWRSRTGLPVRWGPYKTSQPPSNSFGCQSHCCWAQPRGWKDGTFAGTTRGTWSQWGRPALRFPAKTCRCVLTQLGGLWTCRHGPCSHQWYAGLSVGHLCWRRGFGSCKLRDPKKDPPQYYPAVCWTRLTVHPAGGWSLRRRVGPDRRCHLPKRGPTAVATFRKLGALHASRLGMSASDGAEQLFQALFVALQRENARAVLRRLAESSNSVPSLAEPWPFRLWHLVSHHTPKPGEP